MRHFAAKKKKKKKKKNLRLSAQGVKRNEGGDYICRRQRNLWRDVSNRKPDAIAQKAKLIS